MRRRLIGDEADRRKINSLLKQNNPGWKQTRLTVLNMAFSPENPVSLIAESCGVGTTTVNRWIAAYKQGGLDAVLVRGTDQNQRPITADKEVLEYLESGLQAQRWNTLVQATAELEKRFERSFGYKTVWTWAKKCTGVLRVPRPVHEKRDPVRAERFKRHFLGILKGLPLQADKPVKVWFADESRYGLLPNLRRVWTKKGLRPHKRWKSEYKWSYCYGAIDVIEGKTVFVQTPSVNLEWTEAFLLQITKQYPDYEHIIIWDGAGFHPRSDEHPNVPEGVHTVMLPPYSPELNPIEKLWDLIQDHTSNKLWPTIERLDQVVALHLKDWWEQPDRVMNLFGKGWIRASVNAS